MNVVHWEPVPRCPSSERPDMATLDAMIRAVLARIDRALPEFTDRFPAPSSEGGRYPAIDNVEWTNGFWTGMLWLAWELTGEARYVGAARRQLRTFAERVAQRVNVDHHDLGFLYSLSACAAHRLIGSHMAHAAALDAARLLLARFDTRAGMIQAWSDMSDPEQRGRMIIDCNLNLPLLYWAARETGDRAFRTAADRHLERAADLLVRPDASTYHTYYVDTQSGAARFGSTHQGFSDDSCWARGQAWGIYGFVLNFRNKADSSLVSLSAKLANYFLHRLPADGICCWDLIFTDEERTPRDSSAAAIAACGLIELAGALPLSDPARATYGQWAWHIVKRLHAAYLAPLDDSNGVLAHGVYHMPNGIGVDESCIWGDYFYFEALMRLRRVWTPYW